MARVKKWHLNIIQRHQLLSACKEMVETIEELERETKTSVKIPYETKLRLSVAEDGLKRMMQKIS